MQADVIENALQMAAAQLGKVETLIGIGQYDSARMQLRQGAASTIRLDLKAYDRSRHTGPDEPQVRQNLKTPVPYGTNAILVLRGYFRFPSLWLSFLRASMLLCECRLAKPLSNRLRR